MKKILLFAVNKKGYTVLQRIMQSDLRKHLGAVVSYEEINVAHSYDADIRSVCSANDIPYYNRKQASASLQSILKKHKITSAVAIGWQYMLDMSMNDMLEDPLLVVHDSLLPKYRGFAPTPTALLCGEQEIGVSVLRASDKADFGDIVMQKSMQITDSEYIAQIIDRQAVLYADMMLELIEMLCAGNLTYTPQDDNQATYSLWRNIDDCEIDWSKDALDIHRLIRAVSTPYPGAYTHIDGHTIIIHKAEICPDITFAIRDCGKIWTLQNNQPIIVCGKGMLQICEATDEAGNPYRFTSLRKRLG